MFRYLFKTLLRLNECFDFDLWMTFFFDFWLVNETTCIFSKEKLRLRIRINSSLLFGLQSQDQEIEDSFCR